MTVPLLVVDDNDTDRYLLRRYLMRLNMPFDLVEVSDGAAAMDYFRDYLERYAKDPTLETPALIFLDINMPKLNGFEFLEAFNEIRAQNGLASTVVMMFTSSPNQEDRDRAFQWDFVRDFLVKGSFSQEELQQLIQTKVPRLGAA